MATPQIRLRDTGGTLRTLTRIRARDTAGTLRTITRVRVRDTSNSLRIVYDSTGASTFTATASPDPVVGHDVGTITTNATTVTPSGGTAPYTHSWALVTYTSATIAPTVNSPASATTTFTQTDMDPDVIETAVFVDTVTDSSTPALTAEATCDARFADRSSFP